MQLYKQQYLLQAIVLMDPFQHKHPTLGEVFVQKIRNLAKKSQE